eukprot:m.27453 g.27453  ORF g.27453 m.27453 type:complete len:51 (+) comp39761_c0_seq3:244-396(+)
MKPKKKPIQELTPAALEITIFEPSAARKGGKKVESVAELISKLQSEAKAL